jgi:hypothetical protein
MLRATCGLFFCWALLLPAQTADPRLAQPTSQTMSSTAPQLAARISSLLPRRATVSLDFQNLTTLPAAEWSNFQSRLREELRKAGVETAAAETAATQPEPRVRVTESQNARGLLLVAEVSSGENRQVAMLAWGPPARAESEPRITVTQKLLLAQAEPILDILIADSGSQMLVLSPHQVASFRAMDGKWTPTAVASLVLPRPMPRDPRGRLITTSGGFQVFLPVATCTGAWDPELKLTCASGTANWPGTFGTHWAADRNFLEGDAGAPNFADRENLANPCGTGTVDIASSANNEHDSVRVSDGADPMSDPLELPGPVTALWAAESNKAATLVVHNLQTGEYEAFRLGLACSQ